MAAGAMAATAPANRFWFRESEAEDAAR